MRLLFCILLLVSTAQLRAATEFKRTVKPSGGDYTTLSAAEAGMQTNLVSSDQFALIEIDGDWSGGADTNAVTIAGWTTGASNYISVYTTNTARHTGKWDATKYVLSTSSGNVLSLAVDYIRLDGLQVKTTSTGVARIITTATGVSSGSWLVKNCIMRGNAASSSRIDGFIIATAATVSLTAQNCAAFDMPTSTSSSGFTVSNGSWTANLLNCTVYNAYTGFNRIAGTAVAKNCLAQTCTTDFSGTFDGASTNNCSEDGTAPNTNEQTGTVTFTDAANGDFGLVSGVAIGNGADLSGTFTDDLAGLTRTVPWDIGARMYVAEGGVTQVDGQIFELP